MRAVLCLLGAAVPAAIGGKKEIRYWLLAIF
jgi:hypothetical protein